MHETGGPNSSREEEQDLYPGGESATTGVELLEVVFAGRVDVDLIVQHLLPAERGKERWLLGSV